MSGKNPNNVDSKLIALVPGANSTVVPQKRGTNGNSSIVGENSRAVANEVLDAFTKTENARERREKPLLITLIVLMTIQVVAFNIIIAGAGIYIFSLKDTSVLQLFFDVLKYYIGATVVELIGIFAFVIKGTFISGHSKLVEMLMDKENRN